MGNIVDTEEYDRDAMDDRRPYRVPRGVALWLTGLPSSGKTTISKELSKVLHSRDVPNVVLDGDEIRPIIAADIGYSKEERLKSLSRYIQLCNILVRSNIIIILAVNNHSKRLRDLARSAYQPNQFVEIWIDCPLDICKQRDVKGLYRSALEGEIDDLVGVSFAFEPPDSAEVRIYTPEESSLAAAEKIVQYLEKVQAITTEGERD